MGCLRPFLVERRDLARGIRLNRKAVSLPTHINPSGFARDKKGCDFNCTRVSNGSPTPSRTIEIHPNFSIPNAFSPSKFNKNNKSQTLVSRQKNHQFPRRPLKQLKIMCRGENAQAIANYSLRISQIKKKIMQMNS